MFEAINGYLQPYGDKLGVVIRHLPTGQRLEWNPHKAFASASVIKIPVMWEFYRRVSLGEIDPQAHFVLHDCHKVGSSVYDSGILREMHDGLELTYQDILRLMIIISDDTATNILLDLLGMERITATMKGLGLGDTIVQRRMMDYEKVTRGIDNFTTAYDMDLILHHILEGKILPPDLHQTMLDTLAKQQINTAIPLYLPLHHQDRPQDRLHPGLPAGARRGRRLQRGGGTGGGPFPHEPAPGKQPGVLGTIAKMAYEEAV